MKLKMPRFTVASALLILPALLLAGCGAVPVTQVQNLNVPANLNVPPAVNQPAVNLPVVTAPTPATFDVLAADSSLGKILTNGSGMTLYTFTKDKKDVSNCYASCAVLWPPLLVTGAPQIGSNLITSKFGVITRTDGTIQVTFENMPLYTYTPDAKPGDVKGQGVGGFWSVYKVASDDLNP